MWSHGVGVAGGLSSDVAGREASRPRLDAVPPGLLILIGSLSVQCGGGLATVLVRDDGPLPAVAMRIVFDAALLMALRPVRLRGASRAAMLSCLALGIILAAMNSLFFVIPAKLEPI